MLDQTQSDKRVVGVDAKAGPTYAIWGMDGLLVSRVLCAKVTGIHARNITIDRKIAGIKYTEEKTGLQIDRDFKPNKGKRRKGGTGYIKRLSENCWQGRYSPVEDGKRKTYNVYAPTEDECKDKLIRLIEDQKK